ncbi:MAG: hypothetical protein H0W81_03600 [Chloroflexi bacterium]|nr:hypothetical protein [Chloroflexota bacterium]
MTTSRPLAWPDDPDSAEAGKAAMLDAERRLHLRMMGDSHYRNRQPTEGDLLEYSRMDSEEAQARSAYRSVEGQMIALSNSPGEGARLAGPTFTFRAEQADLVGKLGRATVAHEEEYGRLAAERLRLMDLEADVRTRNNQRRAEMARVQNLRGAP